MWQKWYKTLVQLCLGCFAVIVSAAQDPIGWAKLSEIPNNTTAGGNYTAVYRFSSHLPFTMPTPLTIQLIHSSGFSMNDGCTGKRLVLKESCEVIVSYSAQAAGPHVYQLVMRYAKDVISLPQSQTNTTIQPPMQVTLLGQVTQGLPAQTITGTSYPVSITFSNPSTRLMATGLQTNASSQPGGAFVQSNTNCTGSLGPSAQCTVNGIYTPTLAGSGSVQISLNYDQNTQPTAVQTTTQIASADLTIAVMNGLPLQISTNSSSPVSFTLQNNASFPLTNLGITQTTTPSDAIFIPDIGINTCTNNLAANTSCIYAGTYTTAILTGLGGIIVHVHYDQGGTGATQATETNVSAPNVTLTPTSALPINIPTNSSTPLAFTLTNSSLFTLTNLQLAPVTILPTDATYLGTSNCASTLAPGGSCTYSGAYTTNTMTGSGSVAMQATYDQGSKNGSSSSTNVSAPNVTLTPTPALPINIPINSSTPLTFTLTNSSLFTLTNLQLAPVTILPTDATYLGTSNCASTLAPGGSCTYSGTYITNTMTGPGSVAMQAIYDQGNKNGSSSTNVAAVNVTMSPTNALPLQISTNSSNPVTFTLTNNSIFTLMGLALVPTVSPNDAVLNSVINNCNNTLAPGATCTYSGVYVAGTTVISGGVTLQANYAQSSTGANGTSTTNISAPNVTLNVATPLPTYINTNGSTQVSFVLQNDSLFPLTNLTLVPTTSPNDASFTVNSPGVTTCTTSLAANSSCVYGGIYTAGAIKSSGGITLQANYDQSSAGTNGTSSTTVVPAIYAGTNGAFYQSIDNGNTFGVVESLGGGTVNTLLAVGTTIYLGTGIRGLYQSTDNGNTFSQIAAGIIGTHGVYALLIVNGTIYAGVDNGLYQSTNGTDFSQISVGTTGISNGIRSLLAVDNTLYVGTNNGLYQSTNGIDFSQTAVGTIGTKEVLSLLAVGSTTIYAGTDNGLYESINNTGIFTQLGSIGTLEVNSLLAVGNTVYAGTTQGLYQSINGGNFIQISMEDIGTTGVLSLLAIGNVIYAGTDSGLYASSDGTNFIQIALGSIDNAPVFSLLAN